MVNENFNYGLDIFKDALEIDPELCNIIGKEKHRQRASLELIASENFTSKAVLQLLGSCLHNKYSEGRPNCRYYGGNQFIDEVELLCERRCLAAFGLSADKWGVNVQSYSGSPANLAVYTAVLGPHGRLMGLHLCDGGHLTHGYYTKDKKISASSLFFESLPYRIDPNTGLIDFDSLAKNSLLFKPQLIVAGVSCYPRVLDYAKFAQISADCGSLLMADMSHVSGLVAAGVIPSPFDHCDIVTSTTHKTLRGPRAAVIFYRKGVCKIDRMGVEIMYDLEEKINQAVFPCLQGGPHNNAIAAIACAMHLTTRDDFRVYQRQVVSNAVTLSQSLIDYGYRIVTGGTDTHIVWMDLRDKRLSGAKGEHILESVSIACNKNTVPGDVSALNPSGIRFGTAALTTRGMDNDDMRIVAKFIHEALCLALDVVGDEPRMKLLTFKKLLCDDQWASKVRQLRHLVVEFAERQPLPCLDDY